MPDKHKNVRIFAFFYQNIWSYRKKAVPLHRSPGNSSPRYNAGEESGFFIFKAKSELDILTEAFSTQRLSKYVAYNLGDAEKTVKHYKANLRWFLGNAA